MSTSIISTASTSYQHPLSIFPVRPQLEIKENKIEKLMAHNYKQRMIETKRKSKNSKTVRNITKLRMRLDEMKGTTQNYSKHYMLQRKQAHNSIQCFVIKSREINNTERRNSSMTLIHPELLSVLILWFILQQSATEISYQDLACCIQMNTNSSTPRNIFHIKNLWKKLWNQSSPNPNETNKLSAKTPVPPNTYSSC